MSKLDLKGDTFTRKFWQKMSKNFFIVPFANKIFEFLYYII